MMMEKENDTCPLCEEDDLMREIKGLLPYLERDCLLALCSQARAMVKGHKEYGPLDINTKKKDWLEEALEECRDLSNYLTFRIMQLKRYQQ